MYWFFFIKFSPLGIGSGSGFAVFPFPVGLFCLFCGGKDGGLRGRRGDCLLGCFPLFYLGKFFLHCRMCLFLASKLFVSLRCGGEEEV